MGRWDDRDNRDYSRPMGRRITLKTIRRIIYVGFAVLGIFMLAFFISRAGLNVNVIERGEAMGAVTTISVHLSNNSFETMRNVTVQFGDKNPVQYIGDMAPFSSVLVSPDGDDFGFKEVTVTANEGAVSVVKQRSMMAH